MKSYGPIMSAVLIFLFSLAGQAQSNLKKANRAFESLDYPSAVLAFESMIKAGAVLDLTSKHRLAYSYKMTQQNGKAASLYTELSNQVGVDPEVYFEYGDLLRSETDFVQAKIYFEKYKIKSPVIAEYFIQACDYAIVELGRPNNCKLSNMPTNTDQPDQAPVSYRGGVIMGSGITGDLTAKTPGGTELKTAPQIVANPNTFPSRLEDVLTDEAMGKGSASFSEDGSVVAFTRTGGKSLAEVLRSKSGMNIHFSHISKSGSWSEPVAFPFARDEYVNAFPSLSKDGNTLYFASNQPGGFGGFDLYTSKKTGENTWTVPENMGSIINTPGNELSPYTNQNDLFFSSDWHLGFGGFDVFKTTQNGVSWTDIANLGACVNSTKDEFNFLIDQNGDAYFTSNRQGGKGAEDIYKTAKIVLRNQQNLKPLTDSEIGIKSGLDVDVKAPQMNMNSAMMDDVYEDPAVYNRPELQSEKVYFIQIAAMSQFNDQIAARFEKYTRYGDVFMVQADNAVKIRIGVFPNLNAALSQLRILKSNGIRDAFVIGDILDESRVKVLYKGSTDFLSTPAESTENTDGQYKIRVAEFQAPDWFDSSKINDLGRIEHWTKSGKTIIILGDFNNETEAQSVLSKLTERGYKDAYICSEKDGKLYRVNK